MPLGRGGESTGAQMGLHRQALDWRCGSRQGTPIGEPLSGRGPPRVVRRDDPDPATGSIPGPHPPPKLWMGRPSPTAVASECMTNGPTKGGGVLTHSLPNRFFSPSQNRFYRHGLPNRL